MDCLSPALTPTLRILVGQIEEYALLWLKLVYHSQCNECRSLLVPSFYLLCGDVLLGEVWIASTTEGTGMTEVSCLPHRCIVTGPKTSW